MITVNKAFKLPRARSSIKRIVDKSIEGEIITDDLNKLLKHSLSKEKLKIGLELGGLVESLSYFNALTRLSGQ